MGPDTEFMERALAEAAAATEEGEVPIGAVVVAEGRVIAAAHNRPITANDPTAHAEILALRAAAQRLGNYRLSGCDLYVTLEPCPMCVGAMVHARIRRLVYGVRDPKGGAVESNLNLLESPHWNHTLEVTGGVGSEKSSRLLQEFFARRREEQKKTATGS